MKKQSLRKRIPKLSQKELKKLREDLKRRREKVRQVYWRLDELERYTITIKNNLNKQIERCNYFIGKSKAKNCPALVVSGQDCKCLAGQNFTYCSWFQQFYKYNCARCKLTKKQAKIEAFTNRVFHNDP